jgi:alkane 1-monooxygenase
MNRSGAIKLAAYPLCLTVPLLAPLGVWIGWPWLTPLVVFGVFPLLGLAIGEDESVTPALAQRSRLVTTYLYVLPRLYAVLWLAVVVWAAWFIAQEGRQAMLLGLTVSVGISSAIALCTAHELMHHRQSVDKWFARVMAGVCLYGHMVVEHLHHHANVGDWQKGATAPQGASVYRFAARDLVQGARNAWGTETSRLRRRRQPWWGNQVLQDYGIALAIAAAILAAFGLRGLLLFLGQAAFAVLVFEVMTYIHHYGLVKGEDEDFGPQHAWAHHCWVTNCLTFNNTFHSDHHIRPSIPYFQLHGMEGAPKLPASYFTMFWLTLVPPLWALLMDWRVEAVTGTKVPAQGLPSELGTHRCR